jgi:hypothetical protein
MFQKDLTNYKCYISKFNLIPNKMLFRRDKYKGLIISVPRVQLQKHGEHSATTETPVNSYTVNSYSLLLWLCRCIPSVHEVQTHLPSGSLAPAQKKCSSSLRPNVSTVFTGHSGQMKHHFIIIQQVRHQRFTICQHFQEIHAESKINFIFHCHTESLKEMSLKFLFRT